VKRFLILAVLVVILPVLISCQERFESPQTIAWDGASENHEVAIQKGAEEPIILGEIDILEYTIDLDTLDLYGEYVILVRGVQYTDPDMDHRSDWIRSDNPDDVILRDGTPGTFTIINKQPAVKPTMIRVR